MIPSVTVYADDSEKETTLGSAGLRDGKYDGTGKGRNGDIVIRVTITNGTISDAEVISQEDSDKKEGHSSPPEEKAAPTGNKDAEEENG